MVCAGAKCSAKEIELSEESGERGKSRQRQHEYRHTTTEQWGARAQSNEILQIVTAGFPSHQSNNAERAGQGESVNGSVEQSCTKSFTSTCNYSEQGIAGVSDSGVGEQPA